MKKRSRIQKASRKLTAGETNDRTCEEKEKFPGSRGRPRKTTTVNSSCNVNSLKDAKATDGVQKPTEVKIRSSGTWLETSSVLLSLSYRGVFACLLTDNHSSCITAVDGFLNYSFLCQDLFDLCYIPPIIITTTSGLDGPSATNWLSRNSSFYYSNRQTQHRHLPPLPREVLSSQLATCLSVASGCRCWGVGCLGPVASPFVAHIPRGLPATGWGPIGSGPAAIWVCLQEMPHQVLQVPQHPDKVSTKGEPAASREGEPYEPVSLKPRSDCLAKSDF